MRIILAAILVLFVSCSPMEYKDLGTSASPSLSFDRDDYQLEASDSGEEIEIRFEAIPDARSYGYGTGSGTIYRFTEDEISFSSGYYSARISKSSPVFTPASSAVRIGDAGRLSLIIFASPLVDPENDWIIVKAADVELSLSSAPALSYSSRTENSIILEDKSGSQPGITYSVSSGETALAEFTSSELPYMLEGIGTEALTLTIQHKYTGTEDFSDLTQTMDIPEYDIRQSDIVISASDGTISVSNLPVGEYKAIGLYQVSADGSMNELGTIQYDGTGGERTFPSDVFGEGFYAASIRAAVYNESKDEETALLSEIISFERDVELLDEKIGRQSYSVFVPVSPLLGISADNIKVSGASAAVSVTEGGILIQCAARSLVSRTDYALSVIFDIPSYGKVSKEISFRTESFEGEYIWQASASGGAEQFAVLVENAPDGAKGNYYIYTSPSDVKFKSEEYQKLRINPLYEHDSDLPSDGVSYNEAPEAYRWNNTKWNNTSNKPDRLTSIHTTYKTKDYASADVGSKALGFSVVTTSSTEFIEKEDGTCLMVFYNKMTDGSSIAVNMGNKALLKNPAPDQSDFELDEYHYALVLQEK